MSIVYVIQEGRIEVGCTDRRGRPSYRWVQAYTVIDGTQVTRWLRRRDAYALARDLRLARES